MGVQSGRRWSEMNEMRVTGMRNERENGWRGIANGGDVVGSVLERGWSGNVTGRGIYGTCEWGWWLV